MRLCFLTQGRLMASHLGQVLPGGLAVVCVSARPMDRSMGPVAAVRSDHGG